MMEARGEQGRRRLEYKGFILIEIMVALVLAAVILTSLANDAQRARDAAARVRSRATVLPEIATPHDAAAAWEWGPSIAQASWGAGPTLSVVTRWTAAKGMVIGIWISGWPVAEWPVDSGRCLHVGPAVWSGSANEEITIRARADKGGWGPPWRSVVPDAYGNECAAVAAPASGTSAARGFDDAPVVTHLPCSSCPIVLGAWSGVPLSESFLGLVFPGPVLGKGLGGIECGEEVQNWWASQGRRLDVYF